ncbi:kinase-like protein, partial [Leucogyrophana mollusca]
IFSLRRHGAQSIVDLLHALIEHRTTERAQRALFANALVRLSKRSSRYPASLVLENVEVEPTPRTGGAFSEVCKGYIHGRPVAIKKVRMDRSGSEDVLKACAREAITWSFLSHPNLLPFYGVYYLDAERSRFSLVSPWMEHGHIGHYLARHSKADRAPLALDIISGIEYLHTRVPSVTHGDLKPQNILVTPSGRACLADFGLSYARDSQRRVATSTDGPGSGGTLLYQAPELLFDDPVSFATDIYAFACVMYEMYSGAAPFAHIRASGAVVRAVISGERPACPAGIDQTIWSLIEMGWHAEPDKRPHASDLA